MPGGPPAASPSAAASSPAVAADIQGRSGISLGQALPLEEPSGSA